MNTQFYLYNNVTAEPNDFEWLLNNPSADVDVFLASEETLEEDYELFCSFKHMSDYIRYQHENLH